MALQGESLPPSAVWYLLFLLSQPPFSLSSFLVFARQNITALSPFIVRYLEAPDTGGTKASLRLIWFWFSRCYFFQSSRSRIECAAMQISRHHTNGGIQIHTCARCVWKGFFNGIWRFQFPLCHQRQKTLWAQLPLSHTHPDRTTHTLIPSLVIIETHTSMPTLSCCDILENHTIRVAQVNCEEHLSKVDFTRWERTARGRRGRMEPIGGRRSARKRSGRAEKVKMVR